MFLDSITPQADSMQEAGKANYKLLQMVEGERYRSLACQLHRPISRPRHALQLPPELLICIFLEIASDYLFYLFTTETTDLDEIQERLDRNPFPTFLQVSHQYREISFKVLEGAIGLKREPDGSLPRDPWGSVHYVLKYVHLLHCGTPETVEEHAKEGPKYCLAPMLRGYLHVSWLTCSERNFVLLDKVMKELKEETKRIELLDLKSNERMHTTFSRWALAVSWCLQFRLAMLPLVGLRLLPASDDRVDVFIRLCYGTFYIISDVRGSIAVTALQSHGPIPPAPITFPKAVNEDLIHRLRFIKTLWQFQTSPVLSAEESLMKMTQNMLDQTLTMAMPRRPLTELKRRASFSAVQDIQVKSRVRRQQECVCKGRIWLD